VVIFLRCVSAAADTTQDFSEAIENLRAERTKLDTEKYQKEYATFRKTSEELGKLYEAQDKRIEAEENARRQEELAR
jgi:hypothetical protein